MSRAQEAANVLRAVLAAIRAGQADEQQISRALAFAEECETTRFRSDCGTDRWIEENLGLPDFGWAVNVGASDGLLNDNTVWLEDLGWNVLCIEPIPSIAAQCRKNRKWVCEAACSDESGKRTFDVCGVPPHQSDSALETRGPTIVSAKITVDCRKLNGILSSHSFPRLDYLSVDVEGWEKEVMAGLNLYRWQPQVMVIESWDDTFPTPEGYTRRTRVGHDNVYTRTP